MSLDVNLTGQGEPVDRSGPVGPRGTTEQSVLLGQKTDETENAPVDPGGSDMHSVGRDELVCRPGLVGPQRWTERSVSLGVDAEQMGHVPTSPVDPEVLRHRNLSFAGGLVGQLSNSDPLCPSGMPFLDELYQPLAVGPMGQPFITGPLDNHVIEPDCRRTSRRDTGPGGSTGVLDPVNQTGSAVQKDRLNIGAINGPASSGDTPPSSDSGVHSWKEQVGKHE